MTAHLLLTSAETRDAEKQAMAAGLSGAAMMEAAGAGVAAMIAKSWDARLVCVVCGPGNNGGDGFVVARRLTEAGWPVKVCLLGARDKLSGDAGLMAGLYQSDIVPANEEALKDAALIVDALFGTGLDRPLEGEAKKLVDLMNASPAPVIAVDIPSGISADTGEVLGAGVRAALTVTFAAKKPGHVLLPGRMFCGRTENVDIGIAPEIIKKIGAQVFENGLVAWGRKLPQPSLQTHKYQRGHVAVVAGERWQTGAARMSARGALRIGAGAVTVMAPTEAMDECAAHLTAVMLKEAKDASQLRTQLGNRGINAAVIGPGAGLNEETREKALAILEAKIATVLDADALSVFEKAPEALFKALSPNVILTPHSGEFARLFPDIEIAAPGKLEAARAAAARAGAVVVLKGGDTVIAEPDGRAAINANAPPDLATAGSGDVLSGFIAGFAAQGMSAFDAAAAGVWFHGACAQQMGRGMIAEDLTEMVPGLYRALAAGAQKAREEGAG